MKEYKVNKFFSLSKVGEKYVVQILMLGANIGPFFVGFEHWNTGVLSALNNVKML